MQEGLGIPAFCWRSTSLCVVDFWATPGCWSLKVSQWWKRDSVEVQEHLGASCRAARGFNPGGFPAAVHTALSRRGVGEQSCRLHSASGAVH